MIEPKIGDYALINTPSVNEFYPIDIRGNVGKVVDIIKSFNYLYSLEMYKGVHKGAVFLFTRDMFTIISEKEATVRLI